MLNTNYLRHSVLLHSTDVILQLQRRDNWLFEFVGLVLHQEPTFWMVTGHTNEQQTSIRQIANRTSQGSNHFLLWRIVCVQSESDFYSLYVS